jgi:hypothetical protein
LRFLISRLLIICNQLGHGICAFEIYSDYLKGKRQHQPLEMRRIGVVSSGQEGNDEMDIPPMPVVGAL